MTEILPRDRVSCIDSEGNCLVRVGANYTVSGVRREYFKSGDGVFLREVEQWGSHGAIPFYAWRFRLTHEPVERLQQHTSVSEREPV